MSRPIFLIPVLEVSCSNPLSLLSGFLIFHSLSGKFLSCFVNCVIMYFSTNFLIIVYCFTVIILYNSPVLMTSLCKQHLKSKKISVVIKVRPRSHSFYVILKTFFFKCVSQCLKIYLKYLWACT